VDLQFSPPLLVTFMHSEGEKKVGALQLYVTQEGLAWILLAWLFQVYAEDKYSTF
jgi:hypothetical protein